MLVVAGSEETVRAILPQDLDLALVNETTRCVVSGPKEAVAAFEKSLADHSLACRPMPTAHAFHSRMQDPILAEFEAALAPLELSKPRIPFISCVTGDWITAEQATSPRYWADQMRQTVRFADGLSTLCARRQPVLLEVGPGKNLTHSAKRQTVPAFSSLVNSKDGARQALLKTLGGLWSSGVPLNWSTYSEQRSARRIPLPLYQFEKTRYWLDPQPPQKQESEQAPSKPPVAEASVTTLKGGRDQVLRRLKLLIHNMLSLPIEDMDPDVTHFEIGFDSLLLVQVASAIGDEFAVEVSFRSLIEEYDTLNSLADHLYDLIPASEAPASTSEGTGFLQAELEQAKIGEEKRLQRTDVTKTTVPESTPTIRGEAEEQSRSTIKPFSPIRKKRDELSQHQQTFLDEFITRYVARTRTSKQQAQEQRPTHADTRNTSGFRLNRKELVYKITSAGSLGSRITDVDGNEYVDLTNGFGAIMFGHRPDFIVNAIHAQLDEGMEIGAQSNLAWQAAQMICEMTGVERVAFSNTGTEAVMNALRLARTVTRRQKIVLFAGSYHGTFDSVLVRTMPGTPSRPTSMPSVPGSTPGMVSDMLVLEYGSPASLEMIKDLGDELAGVLVETGG